jgi:hypothetical protein
MRSTIGVPTIVEANMGFVGECNVHNQRLVRIVPWPGSRNPYVWFLCCEPCDLVYCSHDGDFTDRRCPRCQGGATGC